MTDGSRVKCISPFKMRKRSGKWQEHPSTPFTGVSESCHSSGVNGHLSSLTKEHKVSESPDVCQGGKEPPPGNRLPLLCQEYPLRLHHTASKTTGGVTGFNPRGRWRAYSLFGFGCVHLFSHLISFSPHLPLFV